jgi:hypothetical protein
MPHSVLYLFPPAALSIKKGDFVPLSNPQREIYKGYHPYRVGIGWEVKLGVGFP